MEYDQVCVQVLGKESLISLNEVFSIIRAEEGRRSVVLDTLVSKRSALAILSSQSCSRHTFIAIKPSHTKEMCWKLHGKPQFLDKNGGNRNSRHPNSKEAKQPSHFWRRNPVMRIQTALSLRDSKR